jgi:FkbM family methyltransferase
MGTLANMRKLIEKFRMRPPATIGKMTATGRRPAGTETDKKLIFDIGLHRGYDADFFLKKGFRVVGVEASQELCSHVKREYATSIENGQLSVVQKALYTVSGEIVNFYINPEKDDWGSLYKGAAEKGVGKAELVEVETISLEDLFGLYGSPYYIKCDIEGGDSIFVRSLLASAVRPDFVSVEVNSADDIACLLACGYDRFQIVNQYMNPFTVCPDPPQEGAFVNAKFNREMSGLFGRELPQDRWGTFTEVMRNYIDWRSLLERNPDLAIGWLDIHCTKAVSGSS